MIFKNLIKRERNSANFSSNYAINDVLKRRGFAHLETIKGHFNSVNSLAFSSDGKLLASCGDDGRILIWSVALSVLHPPKDFENIPLDYVENMGMRSVFDVKFTLDNTHLVASGSDGHVKYIDLNYSTHAHVTPKILRGVNTGSEHVNQNLFQQPSLPISPLYASIVSNYHTHSANVYQVSTHYQNKHVFLTASADRTVQLYDVRDATHKFPKLRNTVAYNAVKYHPIYSYYFATADENGIVALHDERKMSINSSISASSMISELNTNMASLVCKFETQKKKKRRFQKFAKKLDSIPPLVIDDNEEILYDQTLADQIFADTSELPRSNILATATTTSSASSSDSSSFVKSLHVQTPTAVKGALLLAITPEITPQIPQHAIDSCNAKRLENFNKMQQDQQVGAATSTSAQDDGMATVQEEDNDETVDNFTRLRRVNRSEYYEDSDTNRQIINILEESPFIAANYGRKFEQEAPHAALDICFDKQGTRLAAVYNRGPVKVWDFTNPTMPIAVCTDPTYMNGTIPKSICFAGEHEEYIVSGGDNWKIFMWDVKNMIKDESDMGNRIKMATHKLTGHNCNVKGVVSHPTLPLMVSCGVEKQIKVWTPLEKNKAEIILRRPTNLHDRDPEIMYKSEMPELNPVTNDENNENDVEPTNSTEESASTMHFYDYLTLLEKTATNAAMFEQETNDLNDDQMEGVIALYDAIEGISDDEAATTSGPSRNYLTT